MTARVAVSAERFERIRTALGVLGRAQSIDGWLALHGAGYPFAAAELLESIETEFPTDAVVLTGDALAELRFLLTETSIGAVRQHRENLRTYQPGSEQTRRAEAVVGSLEALRAALANGGAS